MQQDMYTLKDAARILRVQPHVLTYVFSTRKLPEPMRLGGRRVFTAADLARINEFLQLHVDLKRRDHA